VLKLLDDLHVKAEAESGLSEEQPSS
jgi:hypothetical protein